MSRAIFLCCVVWLSSLAGLVVAQDMRLADILIDGQDWELVGEGFAFTEGPAVDAKGNLYFTDVFRAKIYRLDEHGKPEIFVDKSFGTNGLMFGPDGRLYGCQNGKKRVVAYGSAGNDTPIAEDVNSNDLVVTRAARFISPTPSISRSGSFRPAAKSGSWIVESAFRMGWPSRPIKARSSWPTCAARTCGRFAWKPTAA